MTHATLLWAIWQDLLRPFASAFTRPGHRRFFAWITAMAQNVAEHTVTQSVLAIERPADSKAMQTFAETGAWRGAPVTRTLAQLVEEAPGRISHGYHVSAAVAWEFTAWGGRRARASLGRGLPLNGWPRGGCGSRRAPGPRRRRLRGARRSGHRFSPRPARAGTGPVPAARGTPSSTGRGGR